MNLAHITYHLASCAHSLSDLAKLGEVDDREAKIFEKIMGLKYVPRDSSITAGDQLRHIIEKLMCEYFIRSEKIKYVFFAHTGDYVFPWGSNNFFKIIQKFQFNNALYFGSVLHKCAGGFRFLNLSNKLFCSLGEQDCILLLIADSAFTHSLSVIPGSTILGDAATAIVLKKSDNAHFFIDAYFYVQGQFAKGIWGDRDEQLAFQSTYVENLSKIITHIVEKNNLSLDKIKCIFPHNVNSISWKRVIQALSLSDDQVYLKNVSKTAHCFGSDPFFNLKDGISEKIILPGDYYLLVTMGLGATFGVMLFRY